MSESVSNSKRSQADFALRFFAASFGLFGIAGGIAYLLITYSGMEKPVGEIRLPNAFRLSTLLLAVGSLSMHRAMSQVRIERQKPFRRALLTALSAGTVFVGIQSYGLWLLMQSQEPTKAFTEVAAFIFLFAGLHGLHFLVALLFLVFVTLKAMTDRYDHEYYWGVTVCAFFWHALGIVWLGILWVFAVAT